VERGIAVAIVEEHTYGYAKQGKVKTRMKVTAVDGDICKGMALGCVGSNDHRSDVEERQSACVPCFPDLPWTKSWTLDDKHLQTPPPSRRSTAVGPHQMSSGGVRSPVPSVHPKQNAYKTKRFFDRSALFELQDP
jgi:hypothetical protein